MSRRRSGAGTDRVQVPDPETAHIMDLWTFALSYDGYARHGADGHPGEIANAARGRYDSDKVLPDTLALLRCCLFYEQRRYHHYGTEPDPETLRYLHALVAAIASITPDVPNDRGAY